MTAAQLRHLAELNDQVAEWTTNPSWARAFKAAAHMARLEADRQERAEKYRQLRYAVQAIKAATAS